MNLIETIKQGYIRSFDFAGRSSRTEFWGFLVFVIIVSIAIEGILELGTTVQLFLLITLVPLISVSFRRKNDTSSIQILSKIILAFYFATAAIGTYAMVYLDSDALLLFDLLEPFSGLALIVCLVLLARPSCPKENRYGPKLE